MNRNYNGNQQAPETTEVVDIDTLMGSGVGSDRDFSPTPQNLDSPNNNEEGDNGGDNNQPTPDNPPNSDDTGKNLVDYLVSLNNDNLTEEDSKVKEDILAKFNAQSIDSDGNLIDDAGNIVTTVDEIEEYLNSPEILLDEQGNQVDEQGNIIKTKQQLDLDSSVVNEIHKGLDVEFLDDSGNPKVYTDDEEGFKNLADDLANYRLDLFKEQFFNSHPELTEVAKHILAGGKVEDFQSGVDYLSIDTKKLSDAQKLNFIKQSLIASGMDEGRAERFTNLTKEANEIDKELPSALKTLNEIEERKIQQREEAYQSKLEEDNKKMIEYWTDVQTTVNNGSLGSVKIPESEKKAFFDYISKPVNNAQQSQEMIDSAKEPLDMKLMVSFMRYKKFNFGDLVNQLAKEEKVKSLRERLNKNKNTNTPIKDGNRGQRTYTGDISLDDL